MITRRGTKYKTYFLNCDPMPLASGRFSAQIVISSDEGNDVVERTFPPLGEFDTEDEAVEYSKSWGRRWVDDNG